MLKPTGEDYVGEPSGSRNPGVLEVVFILCLAVSALAIRVAWLDERPMHGDEANQAYKAGILLETGRYIYDPHDHHGPTLYYLALVPAWLTGQSDFAQTTEITYRIVPVLFGVGLVLLLVPLRTGLGPWAGIYAALLLTLSPAFVFYSRYFIQETLLVFFTSAAIVAAWKYASHPSWGWALGLGASLSLMHATKETAAIAYLAMAGALAVQILAKRGAPAGWAAFRSRIKPAHAAGGLLLGLGLSIILFTAFFTHPRGPLDSVLSYANYFERAGGAGIHDKPWHYYLGLLAYTHRGPGPWWSEGFVLAMALVGLAAAFLKRDALRGDTNLIRFLAVYTVLMTLFYSAVPYKTPWTLLSFYHGMVLLAGVGMAALVRLAPHPLFKAGALVVFAAGCTHLGLQTYRTEFNYYADPRNPYVYAHTSTAFLRLAQRAEDLAALHPDGKDMLIRVIQPDRDYWPIPWYLRTFRRVGYWHDPPEDLDAPLIIADPALGAFLDDHLKDEYVVEMHSLRPAVIRRVYIEKGLWDSFMKPRQ